MNGAAVRGVQVRMTGGERGVGASRREVHNVFQPQLRVVATRYVATYHRCSDHLNLRKNVMHFDETRLRCVFTHLYRTLEITPFCCSSRYAVRTLPVSALSDSLERFTKAVYDQRSVRL